MSQRYFTGEHEWIEIEGEEARIGITDYAQRALGEIVFVELPQAGDELACGEVLAGVESIKTAADVYAPFDLEVIEANEVLEDSPELLNQDPEGSWIARVRLASTVAVDGLLDLEAYQAVLADLEG